MAGKARVWTVETVRSRCHVEQVEDGCWLWKQSASNRGKTPQACINGSTKLVARWLLEHLSHDVKGRCVGQRCGQKLCLNPAHLVLRDMGEVLRQAYAEGSRNSLTEYAGRLASAQRSGLAKFTPQKVREIRARLNDGATVDGLAAELDVWPKTIRQIKYGRSWRETMPTASVFSLGGRS